MVSFHEKRRRLVAASICENRALETYVSQWDVVPRRLQLRLCDDLQFEHAGSNLAGGDQFLCLQWWWLAQGTRERPSYGDRGRLVQKPRSAPNLCGRQEGNASVLQLHPPPTPRS